MRGFATPVAFISLDSLVPFVQRGHGPEGKEEKLKELEGIFGVGTGGCFVHYLGGFVAFAVAPWNFLFCR